MKLLALISLLIPTISFATMQYCDVNVYNVLSTERVFDHSSTGVAIKNGNFLGLRVDGDDINYNSGPLRKRIQKGQEYFTDRTSNKLVFALYMLEDKTIERYMIYDTLNSKTYEYFNCEESTE